MVTWATIPSALATTSRWRLTRLGSNSGTKPRNRCLDRAALLSRVTRTETLLGTSRVVAVGAGADEVLGVVLVEEAMAGEATAVTRASTFEVWMEELEGYQGSEACRVAWYLWAWGLHGTISLWLIH